MLPSYGFAGLEHYVALWHNRRWNVAYTNLFIFGVLYVIGAMAIGLLLAILIDQRVRGEAVWRTIYLYPLAVSFVVTGTVWSWLFNPTSGIQFFVRSYGWTDFTFAWTTNRNLAIYAIVVTGIWQASGFAMALFLAGLRSVDQDLVKAAQIDGAGMARIYRKVVIPAIGPIFIAVLVVLLQFAIKTFDLALALTGGGPGIATTFPAIYVYDLMFQRGQIAEGAAAAIMILLALAVVLVPYSLWLVWRRRKESGHG
jgi:glucose/mannose transport system permease protein